MSIRRQNLFVTLVLCLITGGCGPALGAMPEGDARPGQGLVISGSLIGPDGPDLPAEGLVVVEVSDSSRPGGPVVAERRIAPEALQVPIPFSIQVARSALSEAPVYELRGHLLSQGRLSWVTDPVPVDPNARALDLGPIRLHPYAPMTFSAELACGDRRVRVGFAEGRMRLAVGDQTLDLRQVVSGSGARYLALADPDTSFWSKGERALLTLAGETYPECVPVEADLDGFRATGNEPAWHLEMDATHVELVTDLGETRISVALTEPELLDDGRRYRNLIEDGDLTITIWDRRCTDTMTGMPYPRTVRVVLDDLTLNGCGGDPARLLQGPEWVIEDLAGGGVVDRSRATLNFGADGRLSGRASCNNYLGAYALTGEGLTLSTSATTMMACAPALMRQEALFFDLITRVRRFELDSQGGLTLLTDDGRTLLARRE